MEAITGLEKAQQEDTQIRTALKGAQAMALSFAGRGLLLARVEDSEEALKQAPAREIGLGERLSRGVFGCHCQPHAIFDVRVQ
jgi:hypothetical protein